MIKLFLLLVFFIILSGLVILICFFFFNDFSVFSFFRYGGFLFLELSIFVFMLMYLMLNLDKIYWLLELKIGLFGVGLLLLFINREELVLL